MRLEKITEASRSDFDYILQVDREGELRTVTLFHNGEAESRTVQELFGNGDIKTEREYEDGELRTVRKYRSDGLIQNIEEYTGGELSRVYTYRYHQGRLSGLEAAGSDGGVLYTDRYRYTLSGFLREIRREFPDGSYRLSHFRYGEEALITEWNTKNPGKQTPAETEISYYNAAGNLIRREVLNGDERISTVLYSYTGDGILEKTVRTGPEEGETEQRYDPAGNVLQVIERRDGAVIREEQNLYRDNVLTERRIITEGVEEKRQYRYDEAGELFEEALYEDDELIIITRYTGENTYEEDVYDSGELALRVYYEDGKVIKKDIYADGEIIRTRE
jgi:antitoxin component YwqK of YwqJK toxin-antitoxin module